MFNQKKDPPSSFKLKAADPAPLPFASIKDATSTDPITFNSNLCQEPAVQQKAEGTCADFFGGTQFEVPTTSIQPAVTTGTTVKDILKQGASHEETRDKNKLFVFLANEPKLESQWRNVEWTEEEKTSLMKTISAYRPSWVMVTQARILLLGPVGSGKSSFISSVQSVFSGRVTNRAMVGSSSSGFTKKLQSFNIRVQKGKDPSGLVLCDTMGLVDAEMTGPSLQDILSIVKGPVPEGHQFSRPDQPVSAETAVGYVKKPGPADKIHCVVFVVDASQISTYPKGLGASFQQLREHIGGLGVHQVALLTHVDKLCPKTAKNASEVYKSRLIRETMDKAGALLGMPTSYIVPVKNYSSELDLDTNADVLLLSAVDHILQYADLYFQDNKQPKTVMSL